MAEASAAGCRAAGRLAHHRRHTEPEAAEAAIAAAVAVTVAAPMVATSAACVVSGGASAASVEVPAGQAEPMAMVDLAVAGAACAFA